MKIAVTGAAGKVGYNLCEYLESLGHETMRFDVREKEGRPVEILDVTDKERVLELMEGADAVAHLAGIPAPGIKPDDEILRVNAVGSFNVFDAAGTLGIKHVAYATSDSAFGFAWTRKPICPEYFPVDENHPSIPNEAYGLSKMMMEEAAGYAARRFEGITIIGLRFPTVMAPWDYSHWFLKDMKEPHDFMHKNFASYIDVRDLCRLIYLALQADLNRHEVVTAGAKETRSPLKSMEIIEKYYPDAKLLEPIEGHMSLLSGKKAKKLLGFEPEYSWHDVIDIETGELL